MHHSGAYRGLLDMFRVIVKINSPTFSIQNKSKSHLWWSGRNCDKMMRVKLISADYSRQNTQRQFFLFPTETTSLVPLVSLLTRAKQPCAFHLRLPILGLTARSNPIIMDGEHVINNDP